ncbi:UbiX family flavin prenyltransferase [Paenibacillus antri]|uniref:Flavin prenyltransferase UbiX n=1 Tax=Paenibacillus antri TaxID=2582848 RepID=A0A5R9GI52_9BACL|nr:flavin prenyltransferase UbiX [Paenibacillus antri]TLS53094.1 UbiX family flavin prenyltransferase [Paenibacillus antri]
MSESAAKRGWIVGLTGASGAAYGVRLVERLLDMAYPVHLLITDAGWRVLKEELDWDAAKRAATIETKFAGRNARATYYPIQDIGAAVASGTFRVNGMVVAPCSMGTLAAIAHGLSDNLLERAADVTLKEGRKLVLVPRETPLHAIHLENMLKLARMGVSIVPASPGLYHRAQTVEELVDFMVGKTLDSMGIDHELYRRWGEGSPHDEAE